MAGSLNAGGRSEACVCTGFLWRLWLEAWRGGRSLRRKAARRLRLRACSRLPRQPRRLDQRRNSAAANPAPNGSFPQVRLRRSRHHQRPPSTQPAAGGKLHGFVKSGNIPLPGVTVTAQNTLTGKRYSTTTDITGAWQLNIPQNGRYVIRTQFAAFAQGDQEAVLNATSHDQMVNFELILASRQAEQEQNRRASCQPGKAAQGQDLRQMAGNAPENVGLMNALSADTDTGAGTVGASGAALPSIAAKLRLQRRVGGDHRPGGPGERDGGSRYGPGARCGGLDPGAGRIERAGSAGR